MKKYNVTFKRIKWSINGMSEGIITRTIEAKTVKSANNKAKKMESFGKARTWYILLNVELVA